ncbi:MAG: glycosyltransferase family 2 protein, partial [Bacteroidia bacterium]|nr:glycosyltransferase family 2 protein [Bacteroidia bacterium]
ALNEEESIGKTIEMIPFNVLKESGFDPEVLIVDGDSTDRTVEKARELGARVVFSRRGYGRQYKMGFKEAKGEIIITADSDCSYPMEEIPGLINILLSENLDFISTNRFANMDKDSMSFLNKLGNKILTFSANLLFDFRINDSQSGMWIIRKNIFDSINLTGNGMSLSQEIKIRSYKNFKVREVDSTYRKRVGKVKLRMFVDGMDNLYNLLKLRIFG